MEEGTNTPVTENAKILPVRKFIFQLPTRLRGDEMKAEEGNANATVTTEKKELPAIKPLYVSSIQTFETSGYFTGTFKRSYPTREKSSKLVTLADNRNIEIIPTQKYGYPNAHDLDFLRALFRIIDEQAERVERIEADGKKSYHRQPPTPVAVQTKTLIRYAGREIGARERKLLNDFLHRNAATRMHGEFEDPKTREFKLADVALFSQVVTRGEKTKEGIEAESHFIWLTPFAIRYYFWRRGRSEDIIFHNLLTQAYAKVIYPYLDSGWFAAFMRGGKERTRFQKAYSAVCYLLDLSRYKHESQIRRQLDPGHEELKALGYLDRWEYSQREDKEWIISWFPGEKWFADKEARERRDIPRIEGKTGQGIDEEREAAIKLLVKDILAVFGDEHSEAFYFKAARRLPHHEIRATMKSTEYDTMIDPSRNHVDNPAAIFTNRLFDIAGRYGIALV